LPPAKEGSKSALRHRTDASAIRVAGKLTSAPMLFINNQFASAFDNLDLE